MSFNCFQNKWLIIYWIVNGTLLYWESFNFVDLGLIEWLEIVSYIDLQPGQTCHSKVMHRKEVTHFNGQ